MKAIQSPFLRIIARTIIAFGINPIIFLNSLRGIPSYVKDLFTIYRLKKSNNDFKKVIISPCMGDRYDEGGDMQSIYFQQDLFVAQQLFKDNPATHLDIGSRTDGFVAHVATFRQIDIVDIRDINSKVTNIAFKQSDMMKPSPELYNQYSAVSSLHAIEHFGLGRYGDPIDLDGHLKAIDNIYHIIKEGGLFYFSTPIGPQRIEFNAHRVFALSYLINVAFKNKFIIESFSYIDDYKILHKDELITAERIADNFGCHYGCGIFFLRKL